MLKAARAFTHACLSSHSSERGFRPPFTCCHRSDRIFRCPKCGSARMGITVLSSWVGTGWEKLEVTASYPFKPHTGGLSQNGRVEAFITTHSFTNHNSFQPIRSLKQTYQKGGPLPPQKKTFATGSLCSYTPEVFHNKTPLMHSLKETRPPP